MVARRWALVGCVLVPLSFGQGGCAPKGEEYVSEKGRFRVGFPGKPTVEAVADPARPGLEKAGLTLREGTLAVTWETVGTKHGLSDRERIDLATNAALLVVDGKARVKKDMPLGKHTGKQVLVEDRQGMLVLEVRAYLAGGRLYQLLASGPAWWLESPEVRQFFSSFELLDE